MLVLSFGVALTSCNCRDEFHARFTNYKFTKGQVVKSKLDPARQYLIIEPSPRCIWDDSMVPEYSCRTPEGDSKDFYETELE